MNNPLFDGLIQMAILAMVMAVALDFVFSFAGKSKFPITRWLTKATVVGSLQTVRGLAWLTEAIGDWLTTSAPAGPGAGRAISRVLMYLVGFPLQWSGALVRHLVAPLLKLLRAKPAAHGHSGGHPAHP